MTTIGVRPGRWADAVDADARGRPPSPGWGRSPWLTTRRVGGEARAAARSDRWPFAAATDRAARHVAVLIIAGMAREDHLGYIVSTLICMTRRYSSGFSSTTLPRLPMPTLLSSGGKSSRWRSTAAFRSSVARAAAAWQTAVPPRCLDHVDLGRTGALGQLLVDRPRPPWCRRVPAGSPPLARCRCRLGRTAAATIGDLARTNRRRPQDPSLFSPLDASTLVPWAAPGRRLPAWSSIRPSRLSTIAGRCRCWSRRKACAGPRPQHAGA